MNRIKTKIRNQLLPETLSELMTIDLNGDDSGEWSLSRVYEWFTFWQRNHNPRNIVSLKK